MRSRRCWTAGNGTAPIAMRPGCCTPIWPRRARWPRTWSGCGRPVTTGYWREAVLASGERDRAHRHAARLLHADMAPPGQVAAHLVRVRPAGDDWVLARLRAAARAALDTGPPQPAADLLDRALAEPPLPGQRAGVLREAARAQVTAGRERAFVLLEEAPRGAAGPRARGEIALEVAEAYAALFRWVDAVDVIERALAELGPADQKLAARLEGELVGCGLHDAPPAP